MVPGLVLCCMAALLPAVILYFPNMAEITFSEMLPYFGIMLGTGVLAWAVMLLITRRKELAAAAAAVWLLVLLNIGRAVPAIQAVFPLAGIKVIAPVTLILLTAAAWGLSRVREKHLRDAVRVAVLALGTFILVTAVTGFLSAPREEKTALPEKRAIDPAPAKDTDRPNIYWIIPDEYAGYEQLQKYFHYDNSEFYGQLKELGFSVSEDSYNWSADTFTILRDIMYLDYTKCSKADREEAVADPDTPLWTFFRSLGYEIYEVESAPKFGLKQRIKGLEEDRAALTAEGRPWRTFC